MRGLFHQIAMSLIFMGGLVLFYFSAIWFQKGNFIMGAGMLVMGVVAMSNFYLHRDMMKKK